MILSRLLLIAGAFAVSLTAAGTGRAIELIDPAALGFGQPGLIFDTTYQSQLDYDSGHGGLESVEGRLRVPFARWNLDDLRIGASMAYEWRDMDLGGFGGVGTGHYHALEAQLFGFYESRNSPWWALAFATPGLATDFESVGSDAFQMSALALGGYRLNDRWNFALGVFGNLSLKDWTVLPAVGVLWRPNEEWIVQATPPIVAVGWMPTKEWTISLVTYPAGNGWEVGGDDGEVRQVDLSLWRAALSVERKFGEHWRLSARAGLAFGGELELRDTDERVLTSTDLDPAPFAAVALKWAF